MEHFVPCTWSWAVVVGYDDRRLYIEAVRCEAKRRIAGGQQYSGMSIGDWGSAGVVNSTARVSARDEFADARDKFADYARGASYSVSSTLALVEV